MFPQEEGKTEEKKEFRIGLRAKKHDAQRLAQEKMRMVAQNLLSHVFSLLIELPSNS
jgi:hypothetical protein